MMVKVTAAEIGKNFGQFVDRALVEAVAITRYGREDLVMLSAGGYARLKRRDRRVYQAHDVPDELVAAIEATQPRRNPKLPSVS